MSDEETERELTQFEQIKQNMMLRSAVRHRRHQQAQELLAKPVDYRNMTDREAAERALARWVAGGWCT